MLTAFLSNVFGQAFNDILSGYRVFSRRFVKSFPVLSDGFEIETELSVHALELAVPVAEIETPYYARPEGSFSKVTSVQRLHTVGGVAPKGGCFEAEAGTQMRVGYTADYYFFAPSRPVASRDFDMSYGY